MKKLWKSMTSEEDLEVNDGKNLMILMVVSLVFTLLGMFIGYKAAPAEYLENKQTRIELIDHYYDMFEAIQETYENHMMDSIDFDNCPEYEKEWNIYCFHKNCIDSIWANNL